MHDVCGKLYILFRESNQYFLGTYAEDEEIVVNFHFCSRK